MPNPYPYPLSCIPFTAFIGHSMRYLGYSQEILNGCYISSYTIVLSGLSIRWLLVRFPSPSLQPKLRMRWSRPRSPTSLGLSQTLRCSTSVGDGTEGGHSPRRSRHSATRARRADRTLRAASEFVIGLLGRNATAPQPGRLSPGKPASSVIRRTHDLGVGMSAARRRLANLAHHGFPMS